jgi:hypothetical protein
VGNLLREMDYSLQANSKTREGSRHIDRDAQFRYINDQAVDFLGADHPVISVDTKREELVGNFKNNGREWSPRAEPELVNVHDFIDPKLRRAVPYGGLRHPCQCRVGQRRHRPRHGFICGQRHSPVVVDDGKEAPLQSQAPDDHGRRGGSNGYRVRLWKVELQKLADELKIPITVCHFPQGTSKWNKIEHRLFSFITINWRGKPLRTYRTIVQLIAATTTEAGLKVRAELDEKKYPKGVKVSNAQLAAVNLIRHAFHGDWNYTIAPRRRAN